MTADAAGSPSPVAVVVCTHNRPALLRRALESLQAQTVPASRYEVLVVDNASSAAATVEVRALCEELGARYLFEPRLGVSFARNHSIDLTAAPLIAYLDDDCYADPQWLEMLLRAYCDRKERPLAVGGSIELIWRNPRPAWLPGVTLAALGQLDLGNEGRSLDGAQESLFAANLLLDRDFIKQTGGFRTDLGRRGESLMGNEESALLRRLKAQGGTIWYEPRARVLHEVHPDRLTVRWHLRRAFSQGVSDVREDAAFPTEGNGGKSYLIRIWDRALGLVRRRSRQETVVCLMSIAYDLGRLSERLRRWATLRRR